MDKIVKRQKKEIPWNVNPPLDLNVDFKDERYTEGYKQCYRDILGCMHKLGYHMTGNRLIVVVLNKLEEDGVITKERRDSQTTY